MWPHVKWSMYIWKNVACSGKCYHDDCTHILYLNITALAVLFGKFGQHLLHMKIAVLCSRIAQECHVELFETLCDLAVPYWTDSWWVQTFADGIVSNAVMYCSGLCMSVHVDMFMAIIEQHMAEDRHWTAKELAELTGSLWVCSASDVTSGLKDVQDCCQAHTTWLECRATLDAVWDMHVILGWIYHEEDVLN